MKAFSALAIALIANLAGYAQAQHTNYAGQQSREIKALSTDEMTHRRMHALLTQEQIHQYVKLRGYTADRADHNKANPHH